MKKIKTKTNVTVLMQSKEYSITTNTAHLIPKILTNSEILYYGKRDQSKLDLSCIDQNKTIPLLLYPLNDTNVLTADYVKQFDKPISLFVPDGNWRQTLRMVKRTPELMKMTKVTLPIGKPSEYKLRKGPTPHHLCTYEAIARALGVLENESVQTKLETIFHTMVNRVLWTRGKIKKDSLY